jgi:hypothetical protein
MENSKIALVVMVCLFFIVLHNCVMADQSALSDINLHRNDCPMLKKSFTYDMSDPSQMHMMIVDTINHEDDLHRFTKSKTKSLLLKTRDAIIGGVLAALLSKGELPTWQEGVQWSVSAGIVLGVSDFLVPWNDTFDENHKLYIDA